PRVLHSFPTRRSSDLFAGVFLLLALGERLMPRRHGVAHTGWRWTNNLALVVLNTVLVRLIVPLGAVTVALLAEEHEWGLFAQLEDRKSTRLNSSHQII